MLCMHIIILIVLYTILLYLLGKQLKYATNYTQYVSVNTFLYAQLCTYIIMLTDMYLLYSYIHTYYE